VRDRRCRGEISESLADRFRNEGGTVVGIGQREHALGELSLGVDLTMEVEVEQAFTRIHRQFGRIDLLVNNAGPTIATTTPRSTWPKRRGTGRSRPKFRQTPHFSIASWRLLGAPLTAGHCSTKGSVNSLARGKAR
jgi:hypothetical protein